MEEECSYAIPDHHSLLSNNLYKQFQEGSYCDLTLLMGSDSLLVHSCVLASFSPKVRILLAANVRTITVPFDKSMIQIIVSALYSGELRLFFRQLIEFIHVASWFELAEIVEIVQRNRQSSLLEVDSAVAFSTILDGIDMKIDAMSPKITGERDLLRNIDYNSLALNRHSDPGVNETSEKHFDYDNSMEEKEDIQDSMTLVKVLDKELQLEKSELKSHDFVHSSFLSCDMCGQSFKWKKQLFSHFDKYHNGFLNDQLTCDKCPAKFNNQWILIWHTNLVHRDKLLFSCKFCSEDFSLKGDLESHCSQVHDSAKPYNCPKDNCSYIAESYHYLVRHVHRYHDSIKRVVCQICHKDFRSQKSLKTHYKIEHDTYSKCRFCSKHFKTISDLEKHCLEIHENEKAFKCSKHPCNYETSNAKTLAKHLMSVHRIYDENKKCVCPICFLPVNSEEALQDHVFIMHRSKDYLKCRFCSVQFKQQKLLKEHCLEIHNEPNAFMCKKEDCFFKAHNMLLICKHLKCHRTKMEKSPEKTERTKKHALPDVESKATYQCKHCDRLFVAKSNLSKHVTERHSELKYKQCRICFKEFKSVPELEKHCNTIHNTKPYICPYVECGRTSNKLFRLNHHIKRIHERQRENTCDICGKSFYGTNEYDTHRKRCLNMRCFICDLCGRKFNIKQSLKTHLNTIHLNEKKYKCSICPKLFSHTGNRERHMLIHKNSFPYSCTVCDNKFRHSNSLKDHLNKIHGVR